MKIMRFITLATAGLSAAGLVSCATMSTSHSTSTITKADFGKTPEGQPVEIFTLRNGQGAEARIMTYGGIVQSLVMPDRNGQMADIVLGCDDLAGYIKETPYFGALIGRYGNRIGGAKFTLEGQTYTLATNNNGNNNDNVCPNSNLLWPNCSSCANGNPNTGNCLVCANNNNPWPNCNN